MKFEVESLEGLDDSLVEKYEEVNGKYRLKVEGLDEFVTQKKKIEAEHRAKAEQKAKSLEDELTKIRQDLEAQRQQYEAEREEGHRQSGDVEALDKSWREKMGKLQSEFEETVKTWENRAKDLTVNSVASSLANELAVQGSAKALMPLIQSRLAMDVRDGELTTVVLTDGKPSALSLDDLKAEFRNDPAFAPLIVGSKASGGGATGGSSSGGGASTSKKSFAEMSLQERAAYRKAQREAG